MTCLALGNGAVGTAGGGALTSNDDLDLHYLCLQAADSPSQNLSQFFPQSNDFIHTARINGGNVLVHCLAGASRSVTIAVAYIMTVTSLNSREALRAVRGARDIACPNDGFQKQLHEFEGRKLNEERRRLRGKYSRAQFWDDERECRKLLSAHRAREIENQAEGQRQATICKSGQQEKKMILVKYSLICCSKRASANPAWRLLTRLSFIITAVVILVGPFQARCLLLRRHLAGEEGFRLLSTLQHTQPLVTVPRLRAHLVIYRAEAEAAPVSQIADHTLRHPHQDITSLRPLLKVKVASRATSAPVRHAGFSFDNLEHTNTSDTQEAQLQPTGTAHSQVRKRRTGQLHHTFSLPESILPVVQVTEPNGTSSQVTLGVTPYVSPARVSAPECGVQAKKKSESDTSKECNVESLSRMSNAFDEDKVFVQTADSVIHPITDGQSPLRELLHVDTRNDENKKLFFSVWRSEIPNQSRRLSTFTQEELKKYHHRVANIIYGEQGLPTGGEGNLDKKEAFVLPYPHVTNRSSSKKRDNKKIKRSNKNSGGTIWQVMRKMAIDIMVDCFPCFDRWVREKRIRRRSKIAPQED
ncbi:dual specificity protein phosphatase 22-B-like [Tropilaelaps mercedesae]|uniref:Dual specificity protein phosphatase 22-B-like n=1 Tax=Tropilaelaps mercedesae TaxID=418985 RepID=A0A1V9XMI7_9ACAR|nr:dual specificity protein phosphatase 22-B-like [Tropilaelaps mercedesae]